MRAPLLYDSNDTAYYVDPNSNSNWQGLTLRGKAQSGLTGLSNWKRPDITGDSNYWGGQMGWGQIDLDAINGYGCGFWDSWSNPANQPSGTSHWTGFNCQHHVSYGWQMCMGAGAPGLLYVRGHWGGGWDGWYKVALYENNSNADRAFYASVFYSSSNTGYYLSPAATSNLNVINAAGNITAYYSDERLKTKLGNIPNALNKVLSLNGFYFEANETAQALGYTKKKEVGVSAQEVEAVLPEIIAPAPIDNKYKTLDYSKLVPLLIEAIKEQQQQIEKQQSQIDELKLLVQSITNK